MPKPVIIELTEIERETLAAFIKKGREREHERAMTIQWLSEGSPVSEIALRQGRHPGAPPPMAKTRFFQFTRPATKWSA